MRRIGFSDLARDELRAALAESLQKWGVQNVRQFMVALKTRLEQARHEPLSCAREGTDFVGLRKFNLHKQPYRFVFIFDEETITIIACIHKHRQPQNWFRRIDSSR